MKGQIFIDNSEIGTVNFKIIDENMGAIGGNFIALENYLKFKNEVQKLTHKNGSANSQNFNFRIVVKNIEVNPVGGICLIDSEEFAELYLDAAGISESELKKLIVKKINMAAGGPHDHPLTDIVNFKLKVYNEVCDQLVREISKLVSMNELYEMFDWFDNFSATKSQLHNFEIELNKKLENLKTNAKRNGWEI